MGTANCRLARIHERARFETSQHRLHIHVFSLVLGGLGIYYAVEDGQSFLTDRRVHMNIVIQANVLQHASKAGYRSRRTFMDEATMFLKRISANIAIFAEARAWSGTCLL